MGKYIKFIPSAASALFWAGFQMSGIVFPMLGKALMGLAILLLVIPAWPFFKRILIKPRTKVKTKKQSELALLLTVLVILIVELIIFGIGTFFLESKKHKPDLTYEDAIVTQFIDDANKIIIVDVQIKFRNKGDKPAYRTQIESVFADLETLNKVNKQHDIKIADAVNIEKDIMIKFGFSIPFTGGSNSNDIVVESRGIAIYANLHYKDAPTKGKSFTNELWRTYQIKLGATPEIISGVLSYMNQKDQETFEYFIRKEFPEIFNR